MTVLRAVVAVLLALPCAGADRLETVAVSPDGESFVFEPSGRPFIPRGFNYDHDADGRLIEDYWELEWPRIEGDFSEMRVLGANVVRIHLQFGKFMRSPGEPIPEALARLGELVALAERTGLWLDVTGLGCYHKKDVPAWYDALDEKARWDSQAAFWSAVAKRCRASPAIFCYDLMNEPVVPGGSKKRDDWLAGSFAGKHFVQFIALERAGRERPAVARAWIDRLVAAIRKHDARHLITVGLVPWSLDRPGLSSGFVPEKVAGSLDFVSAHVYPESGKVEQALETADGFRIGKPLVIEETFPLKCSFEEYERFLDGLARSRTGWVSFYWGRTIEEYAVDKTIGAAITRRALEVFRERARRRRAGF